MSLENINNKEEAIAKIKSMAEDIDFCFFCTDLASLPFDSSPMSVQEVDENGHIWFLGSKDSDKYANILKNKNAQLYFSDPSSMSFLSVFAEATIEEDRSKIDKYWNEFVEAWFAEGKDDPNIVLFKLIPQHVQYWDTKHHKIVSYALTLFSAIAGSPTDQGRTGEIKL